MKKKLWMSLPILLVSLVLTGCSGNGNKSSSDSKEARVMEQADISALDPSLITDVGALETVNNSQEGLYRMKSSTEVEPGIAKDIVNPSNNGKTYTFKLRPGLKWSNGDPLTAQDFVYAWRRTVAPSTKSPVAYMYLVIKNASQIEKGKMSPSKLGIKAINKTTLQVNLSRATPYFKYLCAGVPFYRRTKKQWKSMEKLTEPLQLEWFTTARL